LNLKFLTELAVSNDRNFKFTALAASMLANNRSPGTRALQNRPICFEWCPISRRDGTSVPNLATALQRGGGELGKPKFINGLGE
jgi:hypothetical protein